MFLIVEVFVLHFFPPKTDRKRGARGTWIPEPSTKTHNSSMVQSPLAPDPHMRLFFFFFLSFSQSSLTTRYSISS